MKIATPNNIEVLLHYYTTPTPHPRIEAPAVYQATRDFLIAKCIIPHPEYPDQYRVTAKGCAWVTALCNVEMPIEAYVDKEGNIIKNSQL